MNQCYFVQVVFDKKQMGYARVVSPLPTNIENVSSAFWFWRVGDICALLAMYVDIGVTMADARIKRGQPISNATCWIFAPVFLAYRNVFSESWNRLTRLIRLSFFVHRHTFRS